MLRKWVHYIPHPTTQQESNKSLYFICLWITTEKTIQFKRNDKVFPELNLNLSFFEHNIDVFSVLRENLSSIRILEDLLGWFMFWFCPIFCEALPTFIFLRIYLYTCLLASDMHNSYASLFRIYISTQKIHIIGIEQKRFCLESFEVRAGFLENSYCSNARQNLCFAFQDLYFYPKNSYHRHRAEAVLFIIIWSPCWFSWKFLLFKCKAKL